MSSSARVAARRASSPPQQSSRRPFSWRELPWGKIAMVLGVFAAIAVTVSTQVDIETIHRRANEFNGFAAFALLVVLPLFGFPASLLHVAAGIRFGAVLGLTLVAASILIQLCVSYLVVHLWRERFERARWLRRLRERIPPGAHASVCVFTVLLPGAPFAAVNYVLPLIKVPFGTFILCAWPLHTLRSTITVLFGHHSAHLTAARLAVLGGYALLIGLASWWAYRRLQSQFSNQPATAGDRK